MVVIILIFTVCTDDAEKYICPILLIQCLLILIYYKVEKFVITIEKIIIKQD